MMNSQYDQLHKVTKSLLKSAVEIGCEVQAIWRHKTISIILSIQFYNCRKKSLILPTSYTSIMFHDLVGMGIILTAIPKFLFCTRHRRRTQAFWFSWPRARLNHRLHTISPRGIAASMDTDWDIHRYKTVIHLKSIAKKLPSLQSPGRSYLQSYFFQIFTNFSSVLQFEGLRRRMVKRCLKSKEMRIKEASNLQNCLASR